MINPWAIIGALVIWLASLVSVGYWQNDAGHTAERVSWETREQKETAVASARIQELETKVLKTEHDHQTQLASIAADYERKLSDADTRHTADLDAVRSGALRLRDPGTTVHSCGNPGRPATAAPGGRDGTAATELSPELTEFLLTEASRADRIVEQLSSCQKALVADRNN